MWKSPVIEVIDLSDFEGFAIAFFYLLFLHSFAKEKLEQENKREEAII